MTTTLIDDNHAQIADLCRTFGVRRLDVFGSAVREDFDPARSDVDFLWTLPTTRTGTGSVITSPSGTPWPGCSAVPWTW